jgi:PAS domain S-box-containing protein
MKNIWDKILHDARSRVDRALSAYATSDWITQQRARALLFINLIVIVSAVLDGVLSSMFMKEVTPSVISDAIMFAGLVAALVYLLKGMFVGAVNITIVVTTIGITIARLLSTGKFSADVSYDVIQYVVDLVVIVYMLALLARQAWQVAFAVIAALLLLGSYCISLTAVFGLVVSGTAESVMLSGFVFTILAGTVAIVTFLLNRKAIALAERESAMSKASEGKLRAMVDLSLHFVGLLTPDGTVLEANQSALDFAGVTAKDVLGKPFWETVWWSHSQEMQSNIRSAIPLAAEGQLIQFEAVHRSADGRLRIIDFSLKPVFVDGRVAYLIPEGKDITTRKELEASLRESWARYHTLFDVANDAIFLMKENVFVECNAKTLEMFGARPEQIIGRTPWRFSPPIQPDGRPSGEKAMEKINAALAGMPQSFEWLHCRYDGSAFDAEVTLTRMELANTEVFLLAIVRDVTDRKRAEDELRDSEERFRALVEHTPVGMIVSREDNILYANPEILRIMNVSSKKEYLGKSIYDFIPQEYWDNIKTRREQLNADGRKNEMIEFKLRRPDGTLVDVENSAAGILYNGRPAVLSLINDITVRKSAEAALRESEERYRMLVENLPIMMVISVEDKIVYVNSEGVRLMGAANVGDLVGRSVYDFIEPKQWELGRARRRRIITEGSKAELGEFRLRRIDGTVADVESVGIRITYNGHDAILNLNRDISERKRAKEALGISMEQLHLLAARLESIREEERKSISREVHDELGQVLTALKLDIAYLKHSGGTDRVLFDEKMQSMLSLANSAIKAVQNISAQLRPGMLDDLGLIAAVEWQTEDFQKRSGIKCSLDLPAGELGIDDARSTVLFRILQEALTNVARHARARHVAVGLYSTNEELTLSVADDGVGITEDQLQNPKSIGLLGIRERLHPFGGICIIRRREEGGTEVRVSLPKDSPP